MRCVDLVKSFPNEYLLAKILEVKIWSKFGYINIFGQNVGKNPAKFWQIILQMLEKVSNSSGIFNVKIEFEVGKNKRDIYNFQFFVHF